MGTVAIFGGDTPICDVVSFDATIDKATLTPGGEESGNSNSQPVTVISSPTKVDFAALTDFFTVLSLANVPAGTYSTLTLNLSKMQITVLDITKSPPAPTPITPTPTSATVTVNIEPPLQVAANGSVALNLDFVLRKSLLTQQGQLTGMVNPVIRATSHNASPDKELGDDEDLEGLVQSVKTTGTSPFIGSFMVKTASGNTQTVNVTSDTRFDGVSGLSGLTAGTFVEVDAFVDSNGNIVARSVEAEEEEDQQRAAFVGVITAVTRDQSTMNVTQFTLFVRHVDAEETACVPPKSNLAVNVSSSTEYKITAEGVNRAGLAFNGSALGLGQSVVVHGPCQPNPPTVNATSVFLRLQTILGNFTKLLNAPSDDRTGGFAFLPCGAVFQGKPSTVFTFAETGFAGVPGLNELTATATLAIKGLLLYELQQTKVNGITVSAPPPAAVFEAKLVHQLD
jgi:hypothetical protein